MKCQHCNVPVNQVFKHAIKNNQCPACGQAIMEQALLTNFLRLQILLENSFPDIDAGSVATLVVANFDLRQTVKENLQKPVEEGIIEESGVEVEEESVEVEEESADPDAEFKEQQKAEAKEILAKMRSEALEGAQEDRLAEEWGLGNANGLVSAEGITHETVSQMRRQQSADNILTGTKGSFRR